MKNGGKLWRLWSDFIRFFFTVIFFFSKKKRSISTVFCTVILKFLENNNRMSKPYDWKTVRRTVIYSISQKKTVRQTVFQSYGFDIRFFFGKLSKIKNHEIMAKKKKKNFSRPGIDPGTPRKRKKKKKKNFPRRGNEPGPPRKKKKKKKKVGPSGTRTHNLWVHWLTL